MGGLRAAFIPPPGYRLVVVDYSQLEIVILAHLIAGLFGDDDPLVQKVRRKEDIHGPLARRVFGELAGDHAVAMASAGEWDGLGPDGKPQYRPNDFKTVGKLKALRNLAKAGIYGNNYGKQDFSTTALPDGTVLGPHRSKLLTEGLRLELPGIFRYQDFVRTHIEEHGSIISLFGR